MIVRLSTVLGAAADRIAPVLRQSRTLNHVAAPLVTFTPVDPPSLPERWAPGSYRVRMKLFGLAPLGEQTIGISFPTVEGDPSGSFRMHDDGRGALARVWDHRILLTPRDAGSAFYEDRVEVRAGLLTPFLWAFAAVFFRWRQARWRRLVRNDFDFAR